MATNSLVSHCIMQCPAKLFATLNSTVTLCLVMLEVLVGQIQKEVMAEQKKMSWVPIKRDYTN